MSSKMNVGFAQAHPTGARSVCHSTGRVHKVHIDRDFFIFILMVKMNLKNRNPREKQKSLKKEESSKKTEIHEEGGILKEKKNP